MTEILGMRVFYSDLCLERTNQPKRVYRKSRRTTIRKAALVQKKWTKRWGYVMKPCIYQTAQGFFAHPSFRQQIENAAREHP